MSKEFINDQWRLPNEKNKSKVSNYSMDFDSASSDYIDAGSLSLNSNTGTVSAWIKTSYTSDFQIISAIDSQLQCRVLTTGEIRFILYHSGSFTTLNSTSTVNDGNWHNVTFTYSSSGMKIYIDGSLNVSNTVDVTPLTTATDNFLIGARRISSALSKYFNGQIDAVSIFNYALSSSQVTTLYGSSSTGIGNPMAISGGGKPVAYYNLGDKSAFNGANYLVPNIAAEEADGDIATSYSPYALDFDGANDYITIPNSTDFNLGTSFTISGWFNFDTYKYQGLISFDSSSTRGWFLYQISGSNDIKLFDGSSAVTLKSSYTTTNQWDSFIVTYDGTDLVFYINGIQESTQAVSINPQTNGNDGQIGNNQAGSGRYYNGSISNLSIWNTSLTSSQVSEIYSEGIPQNLNNHSAYLNLVSWWQLGSNSSFNTNWIVLDEKSSSNGVSSNMTEADIVDGVNTYANGLSSGMGGDEVIGDAPYSSSNALSVNMDVLDRSTDVPN